MSEYTDMQQLLSGDYVVPYPERDEWYEKNIALINALCDKVVNGAKVLVDSIQEKDIREYAARKLDALRWTINNGSFKAFKRGKSLEEYGKTVLKVVEEIDQSKAREGKYVELLRFLDKMHDRIHSFSRAE